MADILTDSHLHDLERLALLTRIKRQVADGELSQVEALEQLRALSLPGVQVARVTEADRIVAELGQPKER